MAAPSRYDSPEVQLLALAREARREGLPFDAFWQRACRWNQRIVLTSTPERERPPHCVLWPSDSTDRITWRGAIADSVDGWRRAYEREPPTPRDLALAILRPHLKAMRERVDSSDPEDFDPHDDADRGLGRASAVA